MGKGRNQVKKPNQLPLTCCEYMTFAGGFTKANVAVPQQLNQFALRNKKVFYRIMFRAVKETLLTLAGDHKRLGALFGFVAVLHTWGQSGTLSTVQNALVSLRLLNASDRRLSTIRMYTS